MTRLNIVVFLIGVFGVMVSGAVLNEDIPPVIACQPPAANFATLVACKTATAASVQIVATATTMRTQMSSGDTSPTPNISLTAIVSPTYTSAAAATWTPMSTPPPLLIDSEGNPYTCDSLTPEPWLLLRPDGTWRGCVRVPGGPTPTRIVVTR